LPERTIITRRSNDVPTTATVPRAESAGTAGVVGAAAVVAFGDGAVAGLPARGRGAESGAAVWLAGTAGGPETIAESRASAVSPLAAPPAHPIAITHAVIITFLINVSSGAVPLSPRHCAERPPACQLEAAD
jgi:hypothetical protein